MTNFSSRLQQVAQNPETFKKLGRGLEREALRHDSQHHLALTPHPIELGKALTHKWITTDFSESLLEFITPVSNDIDTLLNQLTDVHHFTQTKMEDEHLWPMSMPCYVADENLIPLADYGISNTGQMKTLYRQGLKNRYGSLMQIISGVHFNFSFPDSFWQSLYGENDTALQSDGYFNLIRNYYRFGWIIPYLFGASPAICPSFIKGKDTKLPFESIGTTLYLPYATALRLSDLGYTSNEQSSLNIMFNNLDEYLDGVERAIRTPSKNFADIGVLVDGEHRQLNSNVLQIENELYAPIRPKRVGESGERPAQSLRRAGVEYIEVRSLDVNPYSPIGITEQQVRFLDLFITWCALADSPPMKAGDSLCWRSNWNHIILEGRKPGLSFSLACDGDKKPLTDWGHSLFAELKQLAVVMDESNASTHYQDTCKELESWVDDPEKTFSGQVLADIRELGGIGAFGQQLGNSHRESLQQYQYKYYSQAEMEDEVIRSQKVQTEIEAADTVNFDQFLDDYFSYLK